MSASLELSETSLPETFSNQPLLNISNMSSLSRKSLSCRKKSRVASNKRKGISSVSSNFMPLTKTDKDIMYTVDAILRDLRCFNKMVEQSSETSDTCEEPEEARCRKSHAKLYVASLDKKSLEELQDKSLQIYQTMDLKLKQEQGYNEHLEKQIQQVEVQNLHLVHRVKFLEEALKKEKRVVEAKKAHIDKQNELLDSLARSSTQQLELLRMYKKIVGSVSIETQADPNLNQDFFLKLPASCNRQTADRGKENLKNHRKMPVLGKILKLSRK